MNRTLRTIRLYGSLEKAAGTKEFQIACDSQPQLLASLKWKSPDLNRMLRAGSLSMVYTESNEMKDPKPIDNGFRFSQKAKVIHIATATEGAYWAIPYIIELVIAVVASVVISKLMMHMQNTNNQGVSRSTLFNGPVNSTDQGGPIPIVYGLKCLTGSTIISSSESYVNVI